MIYNSLLSYTINSVVLQLSSFLFHKLRRLTTLSFLKQSTSKFYNSLLSYKITLTFYISLLSCTIIFGGLLLSTLLYNQLRRFTTLSYIHQLRCYTTLYYLKQSTSTFSNSPLSYIINLDILQLSTLSSITFDDLQLSTISYNPLRCSISLYSLIQSTLTFFNSLVSYTINFDVLQLSTILHNQLRSFTTL